MGADIVGWINCPLQKNLGQDEFFWKLKLSQVKRAVEAQVPLEKRAEVQVKLFGTNRQWHHLNHAGIVQELGNFEAGIPQCADCPISGGATLGCYRWITYPVDEVFERHVFDFFVSQVEIKDSICDQIYLDIISQIPSSDTPWHTQRGGADQGGLATLSQPLKYEWGNWPKKKSVDSAQILGALFISLTSPPLVVGYMRLFMELVETARQRNIESATLIEFNDAFMMYLAMVPISLNQGGMILVEG